MPFNAKGEFIRSNRSTATSPAKAFTGQGQAMHSGGPGRNQLLTLAKGLGGLVLLVGLLWFVGMFREWILIGLGLWLVSRLRAWLR
jgi:hypothetical protein